MAAIILVCSVVFLLQFFVSYCRSLIAASIKHPLSAEVQDVTGIKSSATGDDFAVSFSSYIFAQIVRKNAAEFKPSAPILDSWGCCAPALLDSFLRCLPGRKPNEGNVPILRR